MTPAGSKKMIIVATGGIMLITTVSTLGTKHKLPSAKVPVGAFVSGLLLALFAEAAPTAAGALAGTALVTTVFLYGGPAFETLTQLTK